MNDSRQGSLRHDWEREEVEALFRLPFPELLYRAQSLHRRFFEPTAVQVSSLLSIKTGSCPEDCAYCPQSAYHDTGLPEEALLEVEQVVEAARAAKASGVGRFCMGAAWRSPGEHDLERIEAMIRGVKALGMETCMTLGMLSAEQARRLAEAGLDYYNHNLDTSPEFYGTVITTRTYEDRLETLRHVREAGIKVCCGGILGMGEERKDRIGLLLQLANMEPHPESVPVNLLVQVEGTPLEGVEPLDPFEFVRTVAVARILMPASLVRLSAGRESMSDELQALCFLAGANSIFYGERLLTTPNTETGTDDRLFRRLGLRRMTPREEEGEMTTASGVRYRSCHHA